MYIIGGTIKTMAGGDILDGCIRIENGKIAEIGKRDEVDFHPVSGERVIEIRKGIIMPFFSSLIPIWQWASMIPGIMMPFRISMTLSPETG